VYCAGTKFESGKDYGMPRMFIVLSQKKNVNYSSLLCSEFTHCQLRVRIPSGVWMSVFFECFVLSGRGFFDGPITRPEEAYQLCCVIVRDLET
jgi:hypothetical protein